MSFATLPKSVEGFGQPGAGSPTTPTLTIVPHPRETSTLTVDAIMGAMKGCWQTPSNSFGNPRIFIGHETLLTNIDANSKALPEARKNLAAAMLAEMTQRTLETGAQNLEAQRVTSSLRAKQSEAVSQLEDIYLTEISNANPDTPHPKRLAEAVADLEEHNLKVYLRGQLGIAAPSSEHSL